jgi:GAF domain-containing protein
VPNINEVGLAAALEKVRSGSPDRDLESTLHDVTDVVVALFGVTGAGLMFLDDKDALRYAVSTNEGGHALEMAQEDLGAGPCVDCLVLGSSIACTDIASDVRWPGLADHVVAFGVRAVLGVPVHAGGGVVGSLNVYYDGPHDWDDSEIAALSAFASVIDNVVGHAVLAHARGRLVEQLEYALDHRVVIERAIGLLMGRAGDVDAVAAFNRLRGLARNQRRRVAEVAEEVLSGNIEV